MTPNLAKAATLAAETLVKYRFDNLPIYPHKIVQEYPNAAVFAMRDIASAAGYTKEQFIPVSDSGGVANVYVYNRSDGPYYIFAINRDEPVGRVRFALAAQIGNVVMEHKGVLPEDVRLAEVMHFARHLCYPRAVIRLCQDLGIPLTEQNLSILCGAYGTYIPDLQSVQGSSVPPELNKLIRNQMRPYLMKMLDTVTFTQEGPLLDLSSYMEGYAE